MESHFEKIEQFLLELYFQAILACVFSSQNLGLNLNITAMIGSV
jgi:hypothetical protein